MFKEKKILILGATGFVGKELLSKIKFVNQSISVLSRSKSDLQNNVIIGDLTDSERQIEKEFINFDIIINCSGELKNEKNMQNLHVNATDRIVKYLAEQSLKQKKNIRWVQLSSIGVFGFSSDNKKKTLSEKSELNPSNYYEKTKLISDNILINNKNDFFEYNILRPSTVYGKNMKSEFLKKLSNYIDKKLFFYIGSKNSIFNIIHISDVVEAIILCASSNVKNEIFNLSNDCKLNDLVNEICKVKNIKSNPYIVLPEYLVRFLVYLVRKFINIKLDKRIINILTSRQTIKIDKIKKLLNFEPRVDLSQGIKDVIK